MNNKNSIWQKLDDKLLNKTRVFDLRVQRMKRMDSPYEDDFFYLDAPDWVNIVPITPNKEVVMVRQFRHGIDEQSLETPGGIIDSGSTALETAIRELTEETAYLSKEIIPLGKISPNPALLNNYCHIFAALNVLPDGKQNLEASEDIIVELVPLKNIPQLIQNEEICHSLVSTAFFLLWAKMPELFV